MDIKKMSKEEVEKLSYLDIAYNLLKHEHKTLTTVELLKEVCNVLGYGDSEFEDLIGDFYTSLNLDKRFILIDSKWDLAENHVVKIVVEDELDEDMNDDLEDIDEEEIEEETEDDIVSDGVETMEDLDDDLDDDLEDLNIIEEDDEEDLDSDL